MAVNGIELKAGQVWCNSRGERTTILRLDDGKWHSDWLVYDADGKAPGTDVRLVEFISGPVDLGGAAPPVMVGLPVYDTMRDDRIMVGWGFGALDPTIGVQAGIDAAAAAQATWGTSPTGAAAQASGIGDINSDAKGSGARFNAGKAPYELIPLSIIAESYLKDSQLEGEPWHAAAALADLGYYQARGHTGHLYAAIREIGMTAGWDECARVFEYGKRKYAEWNWAKGMKWSVPIACAARHLLAIIRGEELDPESGLPHRGHVYCNLVMLLTYAENYLEGDDRPAEGVLPSFDVPTFIGMDLASGPDQAVVGIFDNAGGRTFHSVTREEAEGDPDSVSIEVNIETPDWLDPEVIRQCIDNAVLECAARGFKAA